MYTHTCLGGLGAELAEASEGGDWTGKRPPFLSIHQFMHALLQ